jgi:hypothetical protein
MATNFQAQIRQQQAAIEHMKMLVASGRARPEQLEAAESELKRLQAMAVEPATQPSELAQPAPQQPATAQAAARRTSKKVRAILEDVQSDTVKFKQAALSEEAARIRKNQADLSNLLHKVPKDQACPELTERILDLHHQAESLWDEKIFLERNEHDGPQQLAADVQVQARTVGDIREKAQLTVEIQKLREKRSKLQRKLGDPKAAVSRKAVWQVQLAQAQASIDELSTRRSLI